jgi:aryl-alcohol dehydrogenase-like predicted oxidoreductase
LEQSLRLLGVDTLDVLQYHGVTPEEYREVVERFHPVALRAKEAGKVRFVGITETVIGDTTHEMLLAALQEDLMDTFMIKYGILNQAALPRVFSLAQQYNVGVFVMAPVRTSLRNPAEAVKTLNQFIDQGLLAIPRPSLEDPLGLAAVGGEAPSLTRAAYQFAAAPTAVSTVLIGTGSEEHLRANVADLLAPKMSVAEFAHLYRTFGTLAWGF